MEFFWAGLRFNRSVVSAALEQGGLPSVATGKVIDFGYLANVVPAVAKMVRNY